MKKRYIFWWVISALFFWNAIARFASMEDFDIGLVFLVIAGIAFYIGYLRAKEYEQQQEDRAALHRLVSLVSEEEAAQPSVSVQEPTGYDATLEGCVSLALDRQSISVGDIQRELKVGYTQAARWMDEMHHLGIVGPYRVEKPRDVLFTRENWPGLEELKKKARP